jgi:menaquinone-specific isochorismate synthase
MDSVEAIASGTTRLVTDALFVPGAQPMSFLRHMASRPRGLWARGEEWVAHAGAVQVLRAPDDVDRFSWMRDQVAQLSGGSDSLSTPLRLFGGFSFLSNHQAQGLWVDFPSALFHLPEFELVRTEGGGLLRGRALVSKDADAEDVRTRLTRRLAELEPTLTAASDVGPARPVPCDRHATNPSHWRAEVEGALAAIHSGFVSKVVLARTLDVLSESPLDALRVLDNMWRENRGAHVFLFEPKPGHLIVGAAPETVATVDSGSFRATAVAGSIARGESEEEQRRLAARLLESEKDLVEHRIALDDMVERLRPFGGRVEAADHPHVLTLARIQHLETDIRARLHEGTHVLDVLETLHPTPAVCGLPRDDAMSLLEREEPFERGWYSGPVGWFDSSGDGVFAPALRCAVAKGREWRLFAGAGIVGASDPALEWEETGIKFEPVLRALAASGAR